MIFLRSIIPSVFSGTLTVLLCAVVAAPILAIVGIAISAGIYHGIATLFGGNGEWGRLVFCFAAIQAPYLLLAPLFGFVAGIIFQQVSSFLYCPGLVVLVLSIYMFVLFISAINAVENIGTGKSTATIFVPVIVVGIPLCCLITNLASYSR